MSKSRSDRACRRFATRRDTMDASSPDLASKSQTATYNNRPKPKKRALALNMMRIVRSRTPRRTARPEQTPPSTLPALDRRTALFCSSDMLAFGAIVEAALHGIAVPDRLAVCGFGNFELSQTVEPPFTTVNVEGGLIGRNAADFLLARFAGQGGAQQVRVPFKIVERAST